LLDPKRRQPKATKETESHTFFTALDSAPDLLDGDRANPGLVSLTPKPTKAIGCRAPPQEIYQHG
jgi:hypothetical protein